jgi:hypothetical protein
LFINKVKLFFFKRNPEDWCLPEGTKIDLKEKSFILPHHMDQSLCLQAPYSLHKSKICLFIIINSLRCFLEYNHFEIVLSDKFSDTEPPPGRF